MNRSYNAMNRRFKVPVKHGPKSIVTASVVKHEDTVPVNYEVDRSVTPRKVLVKLPTRARPEQFLRCLREWSELRSGHHEVRFLISIDGDDQATLDVMPQIFVITGGVDVVVGKSDSKIHAVNRDLEEREFDVLIVASDDMRPRVRNFDAKVVEDMLAHFPNFDGLLHYADGYRKDICTLPVMGRELYQSWGYVYHPSYSSLWCDNEMTDVAKMQGKHWHSDVVLARHEHHVNTHTKPDELYRRNDAFFRQDRATYLKRRAERFGLPAPEIPPAPPLTGEKPYLSLLVPTVPSRTEMCTALVNELRRQIQDPEAVQVIVLADDGTASVGRKRQELLESARGRYVAFVDDDDAVAGDYVASLLDGIARGPDVVTFDGEMTTDGKNPRVFKFSLAYYDRTTSWGYERKPNHLCAVRASLAKQVAFADRNFGEDADWSTRLRPLLRTQHRIERVLYHYRFSNAGTLTHHRR